MTGQRFAPPLSSTRLLSEDTELRRMPTELLKLSPAFMAALRKVGPKKRRSRVAKVVALALLAVLAVLGAERSTREFAVTRGHESLARLRPLLQPLLHRAPEAPQPREDASTVAAASSESASVPAEAASATITIAPFVIGDAPDEPAPAEAKPKPAKKSIATTGKKVQRRGAPRPRVSRP